MSWSTSSGKKRSTKAEGKNMRSTAGTETTTPSRRIPRKTSSLIARRTKIESPQVFSQIKPTLLSTNAFSPKKAALMTLSRIPKQFWKRPRPQKRMKIKRRLLSTSKKPKQVNRQSKWTSNRKRPKPSAKTKAIK